MERVEESRMINTDNLTSEDLARATLALQRLYDDFEQTRGISPDTRDESRCISLAMGLDDTVVPDELLDEIWDSEQNKSLDIPALAALHAAALRSV